MTRLVRLAMLVGTALFSLFGFWGNTQGRIAADETTPTPGPMDPSTMIIAINAARVARGYPALRVDPIIMQVAQTTAETMAANDMSGHIGGVRFRIRDAGYGGGRVVWATENFFILALGEQVDFLSVWADSEHMIPVANPNYTDAGVGAAVTSDGYVYYVFEAAYVGGGTYPYTPEYLQPATTETPGAAAVSEYINPVTKVSPQADGRLIHTVEYGQSLWSIAIAYNTTIKEINRLNGLAEDNQMVYAGQELLIPTPTGWEATITAVPIIETLEITQAAFRAVTPSLPNPTSEIVFSSPTIPGPTLQPHEKTSLTDQIMGFIPFLAIILAAGMILISLLGKR
jgi:LysM repeat protein